MYPSGRVWTRLRMSSSVVDLLADLAAALDGGEVPWYLFGAQAAILHGVNRLTGDVDVTVQLPPRLSTAALVGLILGRGFRSRIPDPAFIERTRVIPFVHLKTGMPLDVVLAGPGLEEQFFTRVEVREIEGVRVHVASAEDIVVMKLLAGRPKDVDDVVWILDANPALDLGYVRDTLAMLEQALAQRDLLSALDAALARIRRPG
jgi:hypothetical protein